MTNIRLIKTQEEHTKVTDSEYERDFRPRFTCKVVSLKGVDATEKEKADGEEATKMEMVVHFPASEYSDSPHSLMPGQAQIYIMLKEL